MQSHCFQILKIATIASILTIASTVDAALIPMGMLADEQTSVGYNVVTGELFVDAPASTNLTSIRIESTAAIFTGDAAENLDGDFDIDEDNLLFKSTLSGSFESLSFGTVAQLGLEEAFVANDLTVIGSLDGGGDLGTVDLVYLVPEPSAYVLALMIIAGYMLQRG